MTLPASVGTPVTQLTKSQMRELIQLWPHYSMAEIKNRLGATKSAIKNAAKELNRVNPSWCHPDKIGPKSTRQLAAEIARESKPQ